MSKVLLVGAGASFGSDTVNVPPLGNHLFSALRKFNPDGWGAEELSLSTIFNADFEAGMIELEKKLPLSMSILQRAMAAYFFSFVPLTSNLYYQLALRLKGKSWPGSIITLNYERLLLLSLLGAAIQPVCNMIPANTSQVEVCFPHGCCNLFCESVRAISGAVTFHGTDVTTYGPVVSISDEVQFHNRIRNDAFPPVMSYFEPSKRTASGNDFINSQRKRMELLITSAEKVVIVGIKIRTSDKHIWGTLARSSAKISYFGSNEDENDFERWQLEENRKTNDRFVCKFFKEGFSEICNELGL